MKRLIIGVVSDETQLVHEAVKTFAAKQHNLQYDVIALHGAPIGSLVNEEVTTNEEATSDPYLFLGVDGMKELLSEVRVYEETDTTKEAFKYVLELENRIYEVEDVEQFLGKSINLIKQK